MEVNNKAKKVMALMAVIDDTQQQIRRVKHAFDEQIRLIRTQSATQTDNLQLELNLQFEALQNLVGRLEEVSDRDRGIPPARRSTNFVDRMKERAFVYIGKQLLYPEPEKEVENGPTLPSTD